MLGGINKDSPQGFGGTNFGARGSGNNIIEGSLNLGSLGQGLNLGVVNGSVLWIGMVCSAVPIHASWQPWLTAG